MLSLESHFASGLPSILSTLLRVAPNDPSTSTENPTPIPTLSGNSRTTRKSAIDVFALGNKEPFFLSCEKWIEGSHQIFPTGLDHFSSSRARNPDMSPFARCSYHRRPRRGRWRIEAQSALSQVMQSFMVRLSDAPGLYDPERAPSSPTVSRMVANCEWSGVIVSSANLCAPWRKFARCPNAVIAAEMAKRWHQVICR
jgi:hypothetical protein